MSATETPVNSVAVTCPLGSQVNCVVNNMSLSTAKNTSEILPDDGIGSMDSTESNNEFGINLKDTFNGLPLLNGQSQLTGDSVLGIKKLSSVGTTDIGDNNKKENPKEIDLVLEGDKQFSSVTNEKFNQHNMGSSLDNSPKVINLLENSKSNSFSMNDKARSSWDIVSKIQVNTPSLGNLLSKTKYIDCKDPNCKNLAEKNRIESEQAQQNGLSGKGGGNLFENIKDLKTESANKMDGILKSDDGDNKEMSEPEQNVNTNLGIIELNDSLEETKEGEETKEDLISKEEESTNSEMITDSENIGPKPSTNDDISNSDSSVLGVEKEYNKIDNEKDDTAKQHIEEEPVGDHEKHDCDINNLNQVQSSDINMEVDCDTNIKMSDTEYVNVKNSDDDLLELDSSDNKIKTEEEKKDSDGNEEMEQEEEEKLLASDSENSEIKDVNESEIKDSKMEVDEDEEKKKIKVSVDPEDVVETKDKVVDRKDKELLLNDTEVKVESVKQESTESDSSDIKLDTKQEESECKESCLDKEDSNSNETCDRKRPAEVDESVSSEPKRSRLDFVIGKLGSQIGIKPESLPLEDDVSDTEDSTRQDSEDSSKSDDASSCVSETETTEETEEEKSPRKKRKKSLRFTRKELKDLVKAKIQSYLKSEQQGIIQELQTKIEELQEANEKWKQKAKDLEKQMLDLTVLQQKHEKRKAKTAALRQISTKSVAVQVDENKANMMSKLGQQPATPQKPVLKTPPKTAVTLASPTTQLKSPGIPSSSTITLQRTITAPALSTVPPKLTNMTLTQVSISNNSGVPRVVNPVTQAQLVSSSSPIQQTTRPVFPSNQTVKSLLDCNRQAAGGAPKFVAQPPSTNFIVVTTASQPLVSSNSGGLKTNLSKANSNVAQAIAVASNNQQLAQTAVQGTVKVIDLTGEEENSVKKGLLSQNILQTTAIRQPVFSQQVVRPVVSGQPGLPQSQGLIVSAPTGTLVRPGAPQAYQLVFNSTSPALRPGMLTVVSPQNNSTQVVRPSSTFIPTAVTTVPPQLKTGQMAPTGMVTSTVQKSAESVKTTAVTQVVRPPPPLQSAPVSKPEDTKKPVTTTISGNQHPATLPPPPLYHIKPYDKPLPPQPTLNISRVSQGIVLSWNMTSNQGNHAEVASYQLFAYQEGLAPPMTSLWKKVGDVKALPLPMACTLTQFQEGNHYHFAIRPVDVSGRIGPFSKPSSIHLTKKD